MLGTAVDDVRQAVAYVKQHAAEYRVDTTRIALVGESAGAQLASMAALKPARGGAVQAVVALYSPSDLVSLAETSPQIPTSVRQALKGTPFADMLMAGLSNLSPINFVKRDSPPFLLIHGTADTLVPFAQSERMCARIREAGGSCELYPVRGGGHGIRWWEADHLTAYKREMIRWLAEALKPQPVPAAGL
jgi:alpha-L-fucosidase 2